MWSFHVVVKKRTAKKCMKMKNARAARAKLLFLLIELIVMLRSRSRCRRRPFLVHAFPDIFESATLFSGFNNNNFISHLSGLQ